MQVIGRYALFDELARGGMATVHLGRLLGTGGFARTVAIKRLHPHLARDREFVAMLLDEARLAGRIRHPNVVAMLDVVATERELFLVMEYVHGEALVRLQKASARTDGRIAAPLCAAILVNVLEGLHAAHEVRGERGEPLGLVHRDVTPHNVMVRGDGTALVVDFGVAKAAGRFHTTEEGKIKGKLPYMAPEQLRGGDVTRRTDIYAAGAVLWEALVGQRLFDGTNEAEVLEQILYTAVEPPGRRAVGVPAALDDVVMRALERDPQKRFATAAEMARAVEAAVTPALTSQVAAWLGGLVGEALARQEEKLAAIEAAVLDRIGPPSGDIPASIASGAVLLDAGATVRASRAGLSSRPPRAGASSAPPEEIPPRATLPQAQGAGEVALERAPAAGAERAFDTTPAAVGPSSPTAVGPKARRIWPWLLAAALAASVPIAWLGLRSGAAPPPPEGAPEPSAAADPSGRSAGAAPAAAVAPASAAAASEPPPRAPLVASASASPAAEGAAASAPPAAGAAPTAASAAASAVPGAASSRAAPPRSGAASRRGAAPKRPAVDCAVPYTVDAQGRKIYKRECL
ncbi:protein kinase [Sorangium sp. So ce119]|uniref:serine/threonine-protein kinase n=1 Tax=Sorangium sp. So ce119 TaxID=3133279 RepID=UPI003F5FF44D